MKRRCLPVLFASLVVLAGCGGSDDAKPTPAELSESLLSITDLESGWSETQRQVFDEREPENPSIDPSIWCPQAEEFSKNLVDLAGGSGADVEMEFGGNRGSWRFMRLQAWSNDDVRDYMADATKAAEACDGVTSTDDAGAVYVTESITGREIGDESVSWSQVITPPSEAGAEKMESTGYTTIARFGDVIMVLQIGDAGPAGATTSMSEDDWWSIVETAGEKISRVD